jgi:phage terminase large subunit-like protein
VSALYGERERPETWPAARVHHVGTLGELEAEQTSWEPDAGGKSPNRIDALTHGIAELGILPRKGKRRSIVHSGAA